MTNMAIYHLINGVLMGYMMGFNGIYDGSSLW